MDKLDRFIVKYQKQLFSNTCFLGLTGKSSWLTGVWFFLGGFDLAFKGRSYSRMEA